LKSGNWTGKKLASIYFNRGVAYYGLKQYRRAIQEYTQAVRINPRFVAAYNNRGNVYRDLKQYRRAIQDYDEALRLNPKNADAYGNRGYVYTIIGQRQLAIRDFYMLLRLRPGDRFARLSLQRLGVKPPPVTSVPADYKSDEKICVEGNGRAQINACTRVLQADKLGARGRAIIYSNRGNSYAALKQYRRAMQDYNESLRLNPKDAYAYINRGSAYHGLKQYRRAIKDYNASIRLNPGIYQAYGNRGLAYEELGQNHLAIRDFRKAVKLRPGDTIGTLGLKRLGVRP
jgi:tetratricopeptide (TPR) repeat protein